MPPVKDRYWLRFQAVQVSLVNWILQTGLCEILVELDLVSLVGTNE